MDFGVGTCAVRSAGRALPRTPSVAAINASGSNGFATLRESGREARPRSSRRPYAVSAMAGGLPPRRAGARATRGSSRSRRRPASRCRKSARRPASRRGCEAPPRPRARSTSRETVATNSSLVRFALSPVARASVASSRRRAFSSARRRLARERLREGDFFIGELALFPRCRPMRSSNVAAHDSLLPARYRTYSTNPEGVSRWRDRIVTVDAR